MFDDNLSDNDRIVRVGGGSEYGGSEQSFLSIRQYESSDGDSQIYRAESEYSMSVTDIKRNQSEWDDASSQYTEGNIIVIGDANSSFQSSAMSETTVRQLGGQRLGR